MLFQAGDTGANRRSSLERGLFLIKAGAGPIELGA